MRHLVFSLLIILGFASLARADDAAPAAYVVDLALQGEDASESKVVVRDGAEIAAKLMMPLKSGDVVFLRDSGSSMILELGDGEQVTLGESLSRYEVKGEIGTNDDGWSILTAVAGVFGDEGEQAPENMVSKGGAVLVPMAVRGSNLITARDKLWLGWTGGKAPYAVLLNSEGRETVFAKDITGLSAEIEVASSFGGTLPERFSLVVVDAEQQRAPLRFRVVPDLPAGAPKGLIQEAAWLTAQDNGAWTIEAAQRLTSSPTGAAWSLREKIREGWRFSP
jgi:hypothetical protein